MTTGHEPPSSSGFLPAIRRARFQSLTIYEVSDGELDTLERGSPDSLYLNFAIFLLSSAVSITVALLTTTPATVLVTFAFVAFAMIAFLAGVFRLLLWRRSRSTRIDCINVIRSRLPPEGIPAEMPMNATGPSAQA
jgi:hypothetical protein